MSRPVDDDAIMMASRMLKSCFKKRIHPWDIQWAKYYEDSKLLIFECRDGIIRTIDCMTGRMVLGKKTHGRIG